jgi:MFS family permease
LLYDSLLALKKEKKFKKIRGKASFFGEVGVLIASLLGALLIQFGVPFLIMLNIFIFAALLIVTLGFKEPKMHQKIEKLPWKKEFSLFKDIVKRSLSNRHLLGLFIYMFVILGVSNTIFVMSQPYFNATDLPLYSFGIIFAVFSVITGLTALKAHAIEEKLGMYGSLFIMPVFLIIALFGAGAFFAWFGFMFFFFREAVRGFIHPIMGDYVNRLTVSRERATVLSVGSMFSRLGLVVVSVSFGFASDNYGLRIGLIATGFALLGFTVIVPLLIRYRGNRKSLNKNPA